LLLQIETYVPGKGSGMGEEVLESLTLVYLLLIFNTFRVITIYSLPYEQLADVWELLLLFFVSDSELVSDIGA
jgi:hypothetical protein